MQAAENRISVISDVIIYLAIKSKLFILAKTLLEDETTFGYLHLVIYTSTIASRIFNDNITSLQMFSSIFLCNRIFQLGRIFFRRTESRLESLYNYMDNCHICILQFCDFLRAVPSL